MPARPSSNLLIRRGDAAPRGWIILGAGAVLLAAVAVWSLLDGGDGPAASVAEVALYVGAAAFAAVMGAILTDSPVRSVARYTLVQCLRLKLTAVFVVLIAIALAGVYHVEGDGTLGGRIRNFLAYSMGITSLLLSVMTLFLSISIVASDVRSKQIFTLATKPLARWQYIVGRWLGVVLLDAALVLVAGLVIYGLAEYLRGKAAGMGFHDRRTVETEVFTARRRVGPDPLPIDSLLKARLDRMRDQGRYESSVDAFLAKADGDKEAAAKLLEGEIAGQIMKAADSVGPQRQVMLTFSGIEADSAEITASGQIAEVNRRDRLARVGVATEILGHLIIGAPVKIDGVPARVYRVGEGFLDVRFDRDDIALAKVQSLRRGKDVQVLVVSTIQLVYKAMPIGKLEYDKKLRGGWLLVNPKTGRAQGERPHDIPRDAPQTFTVSAAVVAEDGRTMAWYTNYSPISVLLNRRDVAVLYRVGGFGCNLARGTALVLFRCAFLAGMGVLAGSLLSFPVSCLGCFVLSAIALGRGYMTKAVTLSLGGGDDPLTVGGHYVMKFMSVVLPDFAHSSPVDSLVDGMYISWAFFGQALMITVAFRGMMLLALACLIFRYRELARVQV